LPKASIPTKQKLEAAWKFKGTIALLGCTDKSSLVCFQVRVEVAYVHTGKAQTEANPHFFGCCSNPAYENVFLNATPFTKKESLMVLPGT
jgi:hypothetical protein